MNENYSIHSNSFLNKLHNLTIQSNKSLDWVEYLMSPPKSTIFHKHKGIFNEGYYDFIKGKNKRNIKYVLNKYLPSKSKVHENNDL